MSIKVTVLIKKESKVDPRTTNTDFYATLSLLNEGGEEYGHGPRFFSGYDEVAGLLKREAGVGHQQLQDFKPVYERGQTVRLRLTLENDEAIQNLGFGPEAK
jgi:hypothetical protein